MVHDRNMTTTQNSEETELISAETLAHFFPKTNNTVAAAEEIEAPSIEVKTDGEPSSFMWRETRVYAYQIAFALALICMFGATIANIMSNATTTTAAFSISTLCTAFGTLFLVTGLMGLGQRSLTDR